MVKKLLHTRYRVNDLAKTVSFYKEVLGLKEVKRHKSPRDAELVFFKTPNSDELNEICSFPASGSVTLGPDVDEAAVVDIVLRHGRAIYLHKESLLGPGTHQRPIAELRHKKLLDSLAHSSPEPLVVALEHHPLRTLVDRFAKEQEKPADVDVLP